MKFAGSSPAALLLLLLIACNHRAAYEKANAPLQHLKSSYKTADGAVQFAATDSTAAPQDEKERQASPVNKTATKEDWDKKIIKTATLSLEVKNYRDFNGLLRSRVKQLGGYVAEEEQNQSDYKIENVVTIKVPVDQFETAVAQLVPESEKLVEKKISSQDVTTEVVDTKSRMEAKKRVRDRYMDLLKQAKNMNEILQVQNQIDEIQEQVEGAGGRIAYLSHASSYSTINLTYYQVLNAAAVVEAVPSYGSRIAASFQSGLTWFSELLVFIISLWPAWLGGIGAWMLIKRRRLFATKKQ